jgi:predicted membrane protein
MEQFDAAYRRRDQQSKILTGVLVIAFGTLFLLDRTGFDIPNWIYSWKMILIAAGLVTLIKHNFQKFWGYVLVGVGAVFLINDFAPGTIDRGLIIPTIIIGFGVTILWKALGFDKNSKKNKEFETVMLDSAADDTSADYFESNTVFGGTEKNVVSKNFRGARITSVFGGTELNLTHADLQQPAIIDTTTVFGGLTIAVPADWRVQSELTTIFGGVEEKRPMVNASEMDDKKVLILKGNCFFGGVEIHNYL